MEKGLIFVISAPSGTGKSTIANMLRKEVKNLGYSVSHTTRAKRPKEVEGVDYYFVSIDEFKDMIEQGAFVEWAQVFGNFYGTSKQSLHRVLNQGKDVLLDIDIQGARAIKTLYPESILIFLLPPSMEELERRLRLRSSDPEDVIKKRLNNACKEIRESSWFDYLVINDDLGETVLKIKALIEAERVRSYKTNLDLFSLFPECF